MSIYLNQMQELATEIKSLREARNTVEKSESRRQAEMHECIKNLFEKGILPIANKSGYKLSISQNGVPLSWYEFSEHRLKSKISNYADNYPCDVLSIHFKLIKEKDKEIRGYLTLSETPVKIEMEMRPMRMDGRSNYFIENLEDKDSILRKSVSITNMENDLEYILDEYENKILPDVRTYKPKMA